MESWITSHKIPLGAWMKVVIEFIQDHFGPAIDLISDGLKVLIEGLTKLLLLPPPLLMLAAIALAAGFYHRSAKLGVGVGLSLLLIMNLGYWDATMETLSLVGVATLVSVVIGVPIGVYTAHRPWAYEALRPVLDLMQTLPTFVYLIPTLVLFGLGVVPGMISTVIFAVPAPIRLTYLGITSVPKPLIEAGEAFGATKSQLLWKVELPSALPTIMAGVNQCIMLSLSMVVIAALVGAGGLGKPVVRALNTVNIPMGFEAGFAIVLLAIVLDRVAKRRERI
ncbi:choline ABC transporter permease subunit [Methyloraptor flagellatus]|jgi:glycine betaine/proline transport system permease protein|uniref:Choline ABC transporter permease subunit n=1 Tax=Methyloraptor flagellatus TaxID=3162530 RepID=A0AAU7XEP2_9HYPH